MFGIGTKKGDREYFVENFSMLLGSGMDIIMVLETLRNEVRSESMKRSMIKMRGEVENGTPLWQVLAHSGFFPPDAIALIKVGEQSGRLPENLKLAAFQIEKDRAIRSRTYSAMMYPVFVLVLTVVIGTGVAWFVLPRIATVFTSLHLPLPFITRALIGLGVFLRDYGTTVLPIAIFIPALTIFFLFMFSKTRFLGQWLLFYIPGIRRLIREVELSRFGYILGTLLDAGLPVVDALRALAAASTMPPYRSFFLKVADKVEEGNSFEQAFRSMKLGGIVPLSVAQMIVSAEQSGRLVLTLLSISKTFEAKSETTMKNLGVILEPLLLFIVWIGVVGVVFAVILPIYGLLSGLSK